MAVNKATEGTWKGGIVLVQHSPEGAEESHKIFLSTYKSKTKIRSQDIRTGK
jgi:hypothetical protein